MYPPHHLGGYELAWAAAMEYVRGRGHETRVLTTDFRVGRMVEDEPSTFRELRWYWRDHRLPRVGWRARLALEQHNHAVLERHLHEHRPDVVSWWSMGGMSLSLIEHVRRSEIPAVAFVHDDWLTYGPRVDRWSRPFWKHPLAGAAAERLTGIPARIDLQAAARYVLVSETVRLHARAAGYALPCSSIAHSGIDPAFLDPRPERPWSWRLLYVGRIDERKGVLDAVAALAQLPEHSQLTLAGGGDPALIARITRVAEEFGLSGRVHQLGMCSRSELPDIYAAADVVLFPVRWEEPWGLVPLEAMGIGRPVIATGRGGSGKYLRDEVNSLLVTPGDPGALTRAVRRLADEPELRSRLRAGGLQTAQLYTEQAFNQAVLEALEAAWAVD